MLTHRDESLFHQASLTFAEVANLLEHEVYDLSSPDFAQLPVETPTLVTINGEDGYFGWGTVLATGAVPQYGLRAQTAEELKRYSIIVDNLVSA